MFSETGAGSPTLNVLSTSLNTRPKNYCRVLRVTFYYFVMIIFDKIQGIHSKRSEYCLLKVLTVP